MEKVEEFLKVSYGSGYGSASGYGSGYGSGSGSGYGYGAGSGDGDGSGSGSGDGSGDGSGYGDGSGSGDGYGYGSGYGYGLLTYNSNKIYLIDGIQTIIHSVKGNVAKCSIVNADLTLTKCYVAKIGNSFAHGESIEKAISDATRKHFYNLPVEQKIDEFLNKFNSTDKYPAQLFYDWHTTLTGSCDLGKDAFMKEHSISLTDTMSVAKFISLARGKYGSDVIEQLEEKLNSLD